MMKYIHEDTVQKYKNHYNKYFEIEDMIPRLQEPKTMGELIYRIRQIYEFKKVSISLVNEEIKLKDKITRMREKKENISGTVFVLIVTVIISIAVPAIQAISDIETQKLGYLLAYLMLGETLILFIFWMFKKIYENRDNVSISFYALCLDILQKVKKDEFQ